MRGHQTHKGGVFVASGDDASDESDTKLTTPADGHFLRLGMHSQYACSQRHRLSQRFGSEQNVYGR
jgi:hypothetical protein